MRMRYKAKVTIYIVTQICILLLIPVVILAVAGYFRTPKVVADIPKEFYETNDNNFVNKNMLDLNEKYVAAATFVGLHMKLVVLNDNKPIFTKFTRTDICFRLHDDTLYYLDRTTLYKVDLKTDEETVFRTNVRLFHLYEDLLIYETMGDYTASIESELISVNLKTQEQTLIMTGLSRHSLFDGVLYYQKHDEPGTFDERLKVLSLKDGSHSVLTPDNLKVVHLTELMQIYDEDIVFIYTGSLFLLSTETNEIRTAPFAPEGYPLFTSPLFACKDGFVYAPFAQYDLVWYNLIRKEHETNGLWRISVDTLEKEKVSDVNYCSVACFGDSLIVFSYDDVCIFNTETFETTKLIEWK